MQKAKHVSELWEIAVSHPFVAQMTDGSLPKEKFFLYLVQDKLLCEVLRGFVCEVLAECPEASQFSAVHGMIANLKGYGQENELFFNLFRGLEMSGPEMGPYPVTEAFSQFLWKVGATDKLIDKLIVLYVVYALYMDFADKAASETKNMSNRVYAEWIDMHTSTNIGKLVEWIEATLDFHLDEEDVRPEHVQLFKKTVEFEIMFFDCVFREHAIDFACNDFEQNRSLNCLMR